HLALSASDGTVALGDVVQHRDHRRHGQPAGRVHRRAAGLGGPGAGCGVSAPLAPGAGQLLAADRGPSGSPRRPVRQAQLMRRGRGEPSQGSPTQKVAAALALAVLLALPAVLSGYAVTIFILIFFYAFLAQAWNIVGGYAGQLSAGHAAFVGIGGYTPALLFERGLPPRLRSLARGGAGRPAG